MGGSCPKEDRQGNELFPDGLSCYKPFCLGQLLSKGMVAVRVIQINDITITKFRLFILLQTLNLLFAKGTPGKGCRKQSISLM